MRALGRLPLLKGILFSLVFFSLLAPAVGSEPSSLPAQDWNLKNLKTIQAMNPDTLTFAVMGDSRGHEPEFQALLRRLEEEGR
jgi:hypothetical protein